MEQELLEKLINHALKLLARRSQSEHELKQKLTRYLYKKGIEESNLYIDAVTDFLYRKKFLDDKTFTELFTRDRQLLKPRSKKMLRMELQQKGIANELIEQTLENYDEEEALNKLMEKKKHYSPQKLTEYLLRQGFGYEIVKKVVL